MEKINSLIVLNQNHNKNRNDTNTQIDNLNNAIEIFKKANLSYDNEELSLRKTIEELQIGML